MGALRETMRKEMVARRLSPRTQESYIAAVVGLTRFYRRSPDQLTEDQIRDYIVYLLQERKLARSSVNVALAGIRFLLIHTLHRDARELRLPVARRSGKLPQILSREEVTRILQTPKNVKHQTMLMTTYAAGLRVSELTHLKVADIDSERIGLDPLFRTPLIGRECPTEVGREATRTTNVYSRAEG
jgi:integrase/recombinase XerD